MQPPPEKTMDPWTNGLFTACQRLCFVFVVVVADAVAVVAIVVAAAVSVVALASCVRRFLLRARDGTPFLFVLATGFLVFKQKSTQRRSINALFHPSSALL